MSVQLLWPEGGLIWVHDRVADLPQNRRVYGWFERRIGSFVCVSNAAACSLRRIGISEAKIRVIYNGLVDPANARDSATPPSEKFRIGIVGQVNPWKGHDDLLEALALVTRRHAAADLHIFGKGDAEYKA